MHPDLRILQICSARDIGGGERHLADLTNALAGRGHEVCAALLPDSAVLSELPSVARDNIIELPMRSPLNLASAMKLARFAKAKQTEIVHAHLARDYPLAALVSKRSGAALVLTRHVLFPLHQIHRLTLRRTSKVIAVSKAVAESLRRQRIFAHDRIVVIQNGIDTEKFATGRQAVTRSESNVNGFSIGMTGHLATIKGQEDFIRTASIVCSQRDDVHFVIAGEDKSRTGENRRRLESLIKNLDLTERVDLVGWVTNVPELLSTFDLFVSPSRSEPFGLSIVEAMAAKLPVIATESEGAIEIIDSGQTGILVPLEDVESLAQSICDLLSRPQERQQLAENAARVAAERFSLRRMVDETEKLYREVGSS